MNIISKRTTFIGGSRGLPNDYEMVTDTEPTRAEVTEAQDDLGYSPLGYGGPYGIKTTKREDGSYVTIWSSSGTCD